MDDAGEEIAVIGIGCNFPGGEGLDNFWKLLLEGKNCAVEIPAERFDAAAWCDADENKAGKTQTTKAALIDGFDELDCKFFGVSEVEADCMDPQQKLLLQCSHRALEDAGISTERISGSRTGVFIGLMNRDYEMLRNNNPSTITHYNGTGTAMSIAANRISFIFNLTGPSFAIDSACSSSLVALHVACQAMKQGDCEMALCGGVNCIIEPRVFVALSKAKMISPEGTSKPFSSRADGYGRGEGCGVLLLKPLRKAREDGNKVWGVISKSAVNQDGHSVSPITKPSMRQQEELLRGIYLESDIANVQYIEAHGTGTPVGDPTEAESISNVIAKAKPPGSETLVIGSVKGNIGHTESAAGVAGLIKVLLMMKHETLVPSVFYSEDSSSLDVKDLNLKIQTKAEKWEEKGSSGRVAGINSFGFGGTNAHVILRACNTTIPILTSKHWLNLFVLSAATEKSLIWAVADTQKRLSGNESVDLQALCYTAACGRSHSKHKHRKVFLSSSLSDLEQKLRSSLKTKMEPLISDLKVIFVFCGNGTAYKGMCRQLIRQFHIFRDKVKEIEDVFQTISDKTFSMSKWMAGEHDDEDFCKPNVVQPLLFATQVGIFTLLKHWGVKADAVIGHSVGEVAAAHCSGLLSLRDAVKVLRHRSVLQSKVTRGKMLVVGNVPVEKIVSVLAGFSGKLCIAAYNSPQSCTVSGDSEAVDVLHERLDIMFKEENIFLHVLDVPAAYHSHIMDPILKDIEKQIDVLDSNNVECELLSTVTGKRYSDDDFCTGKYWAKNVREPVLFAQTLQVAVEDKQIRRNVVFVEIGPRGALERNICETLGNDTVVLPSAQPNKECDTVLSTVAKLFELGINVDWHQLYRGYKTVPTPFPVYQFDNSKRALNFELLRKGEALSAFAPHALISQIKRNSKEITSRLSLEAAPYLWEHKNNNAVIVPGAFHVALAFESVMVSLRPKIHVSQLHLSVKFENVFTLNSDNQKLKVRLEASEKEGSFEILSSNTTHASGTYKCVTSKSLIEEAKICLDVVAQRCKLVITREEIYSVLAQAGFEYGPLFKQLDVLHLGDEFKEAVTAVQVPSELRKHLHDYFIHPVILDYFIQATAVLATEHITARQGFPSAIGSIAIARPLQEEMFIYLRSTLETADFLEVSGCFSSTEGDVLVELKGVRISFLARCPNVEESFFFHNDMVAVNDERRLQTHQTNAIVLEDNLGIAQRLFPHLSSDSIILESKQDGEAVRNAVLQYLHKGVDIENVLFMWGVENLSHLSCEQLLERLVSHCEVFRQLILGVKEIRCQCTIRVVTYRSTEKSVDHISPGFVLSGMLRACAAEMAGLSFQLVDLASVTDEDIQTLAHVINTCKQQEIRISRGKASSPRMVRTSAKLNHPSEDKILSARQGVFALQTFDPYKIHRLSALPLNVNVNCVQEKFVEIQLASVCMHTADYFPVSTTHLNYGRTMYWSKHTECSHTLLALDFSGVVTAVGKDVHSLEVGDHVALCYPVPAATKVNVPERACYHIKKLPFLAETPCVSYFILAWSILENTLSDVTKHNRKLAIISSNFASVLQKVLALAANRAGWNVSSWTDFSEGPPHFDGCHAVVFLPPFDVTWKEMYDACNAERHFIFVYSDHMVHSSEAMLASKSDHIHVHKLDIANVLQKANLLAHNKRIASWLQSLGFDSTSLPLRKELYHMDSHQDTDHNSYSTTKTVQQIVLDNRRSNSQVSDIPLLTTPRQLFRKNCVYVVSGGLSGLGLETVKFIAHNGGCCIATLSRRILPESKQFQMENFQKRYSVSIIHIQCDVSDSVQVESAISKIGRRFPSCPIKGVFHSAAVLHDAPIEALDASLFKKVLQPKVSGALNLHYATLHSKLDYFVCYSSISSFIGNASQCNYAAANSFLDMFCHYRRNLGLAGQSINWGPVNLGLLLNKDQIQEFLEAKGMMTMNVCEVLETLKKCLLINRPQQVICKFNFRTLNIHALSQNASLRERLSALVELELEEHLCNEPKVQNASSTYENVKSIVSEITDVGLKELEDDVTLRALGIDSMLAMTLQSNIFQDTGVNVPLVTILDPNSTLRTLVTTVSKSG